MADQPDEFIPSREDLTVERRIVRTPTQGTRLALLLAVLMLVAAGYFLLSPVRVVAADGGSWDCGTALNAPTDDFGKGLCGRINDIYAARAGALGIASLVTAGGGFLIFGSTTRVDVRQRRDDQDDDL